jgi:hypothetical protein
MTYLDMITKYYDKREPHKGRKYYDSTDELFKAKGRTEYVGRAVIPSWLGIKDIEITREQS